MAKIHKQKRIVKLLNNFFGNAHYSNYETYKERVRNLNEKGVPEEDFTFHLVQNLRWIDQLCYFLRGRKYSQNLRWQWALNRTFNNERLYKSCLEDGLIEKVEGTDNVRVSNKGLDLLYIGNIELVLREYPLTWKMIAQLSTALIGTGIVGYVAINLIKHFIFHLPYG